MRQLLGVSMRRPHNGQRILVMAALLAIVFNTASALAQRYSQTNIVSDIPKLAITTDPNLKNAWGIAFGAGNPIWIADNGTGLSTLYTGTGAIVPLVVTIPAPAADDTSAPTGLVMNPSDDFVVTKDGKSGPSVFIFDTEDGTIVGWSPAVDLTHGVIAVPNNHGAIYKGLAIARTSKGAFLYATDFHNGLVDIYDAHFNLKASFTDTSLPAGYAPFGIQNINGQIFVTFAKQDELKEDEVAGPHLGFVDIFDTDGNLVRRFASRGKLNAPWGLAMAPATFGKFANSILVGNFGDGRISAFDPSSGKFLGQLRNLQGEILSIDGLWAITPGGGAGTTADDLLFTAGPDDEEHGLFGKLNPKP
jgi:uncharacterized protein (TIGR03118 family)